MKKIKTMVYLDRDCKKKALELKNITHKSLSFLVEEGLEAVILKYSLKPKTMKEAIKTSYGSIPSIKNMRDELNKDFEKRAERIR
ncbi:MAG: hypothetical protein A2231_02495 [Candidatus Firestonebacteria bacterium RIFOXYA2_FULL_40_8]|nr:MAG: hypothetical protein A2231_02495 [Candidatus Firestonebacteria bacterium RIFOXYA2_FULL_40_8]